MNDIAIYGGSFNPPTLAHEQVAGEVIKNTDITKIILSPSGDREDKVHDVEHEERRKMIQIFFKILQKSGLHVELDMHFFEGINGGHTTTVQEEQYFRDKLGFSPSFIYGSDIAEHMPTWSGNDNQFIEKKLKKIFLSRPGYHFEPKKYGIDNFILLDIPHMLDFSSSMAKNMIKNKQDVKNILSPEIRKYIEENRLYSK